MESTTKISTSLYSSPSKPLGFKERLKKQNIRYGPYEVCKKLKQSTTQAKFQTKSIFERELKERKFRIWNAEEIAQIRKIKEQISNIDYLIEGLMFWQNRLKEENKELINEITKFIYFLNITKSKMSKLDLQKSFDADLIYINNKQDSIFEKIQKIETKAT